MSCTINYPVLEHYAPRYVNYEEQARTIQWAISLFRERFPEPPDGYHGGRMVVNYNEYRNWQIWDQARTDYANNYVMADQINRELREARNKEEARNEKTRVSSTD
jgi:hypothetical protein